MARLSVLALALLLVAGTCRAEGLFEDGQEYQYSYLTFTTSGVRDPTPSGSSFGIRGNLLIQKQAGEAIVKLSDVTLGMHNGPDTLLSTVKFLKKPELVMLEKPFKISFLNGKITGFDADASDAEWSINIKKGLATKLQMDVVAGEIGKGETAFLRTVEDTVVGTCNTTYSFGGSEKGRLMLIKQRTQSECTNVPRLGHNSFGATNCAGKSQDELVATTQLYYQLSRGSSSNTAKAHIISSFGYQVLQWHPPAGSPFYNLANTTLVLKSSGPIAKPISASGLTKHYGSLRYTLKRPIPTPEDLDLAREEDFLHPEEPQAQQALRAKAVPTLSKLKEVIGSSPLNDETLLDPTAMAAIQLFQSMSLESLQAVWKNVESDDELKNLFTEILPVTGTNPAALLIKELILSGKLSDMEARRMVAFLPYYLRMPSEKLLTSWEDLLKESPSIKTKELRGAIALAFGHLIGVTCGGNKLRPCKTDTINKYTRMAYEAFKSAKTHPEMIVALSTLRNTNLIPAIERLIPHVKSGSVPHAVRPHVIFALQPIAAVNRNKFLSAVLPLILNATETTEIRIAAVSTLFRVQPTFLELQQLIAGAIWERNQEVLNFMMTTFRNYADSKNPCIKPIANQLQLLLRRVAHIKTNFFRSSNRVFDFHDQKYGFGGGLQLVTVYGEESRAPLILSGRANYRISEFNYVPIEIMIRLEGVEDAYVRLFRKLDPKDFKLDTLKDLLQKTMKVVPRQQAPMKMEILLRSQGYTLMYRHMAMEEIAGLMEGKGLVEMISRGLKLTRSMVMLGGQHISWRANDVGLPVGVGLSTPGFARHQLAYGNVNQPNKLGRSIQADLDITMQVVTYMVAYNPLGVSQGIIKARGSRIHLPANVLVGFSPSDSQVEVKINTATEEKPLSYLFTSKTAAFMWGKDDSKALSYLKDTCSECEPKSLVTRGEQFRKGQVVRENINELLGMESHVEVYNCETYTGKASIAKVMYESFKPSEINSHGSVPGFFVMGFMQMRNYFYQYPPTGTCSMKAVLHRTQVNPAEAVEIKLKMDSAVPSSKKAAPGKTFSNVKGAVTLLGSPERKWNVEVNIEREPFNIKSQVAVKIARLANPGLNVPSRALCVNVKTAWAALPEDIFETPSTVEPSVQREVSFVWGEAPSDQCPKANAKDISTILIKVQGNITEAQREAATSRNTYPYDRCDLDRNDAGRSGIVGPMTQACYEAVLHYATPRSYVLDIHYANMSPRGQMALARVDTMLKASLLPYWSMHAPHGPTATAKKVAGAGHIELKLDVNEDDVDLHVHTDLMHSHYENVDVLKNLGMALRNARLPMSQMFAIKAGFVGICDVAPKAVVTFDNVTMNADLPTCYTLISADCSPNPRYAVFAKKTTGPSLPLAVKIYAGGHTLELNPVASGVEVKANDKVVKVENNKPYVLADKDNVIQYIVVNKIGARYYVQVPVLKLTFRYTGDDITSMIPATHRSQHCGLCGDYNGQFSRELVSPSGCNVKDATDLARSYVLRDNKCKESIPVPPCVAEPISVGERKTRSVGIVGLMDKFIRS